LREQLHVRVVPPADHAIGDDGRHQRFDRAQHRDGQRRGQQRQHQVWTELRHPERRQPRGKPAEAAADRLDRKPGQRDN